MTPTRRAILAGAAGLAATLALPRPGAAVEGEVELWLPPGFRYPNDIARAADGTLYVGSVTSGQVLRRPPGGGWGTLHPGSDQVYAGTSLRLDEGRGLLWGASPDFLPGAQARPHRVFALNPATGAVRRSLELPDGGFGNDLAVAPDGTLLVTDSRKGRVLRLDPGTEAFRVVLEHPALAPVGGIGVAGIALAADGRLVLGNYGAGTLHVLEGGVVRELDLPRRLENPDGLAFAADGSLVVLEGAVASGDGKVLRLPDPFAPGPRNVQVLRSGLTSPVNLTADGAGGFWVSEARIRHRLVKGQEHAVPDAFRLVRVGLGT